MFQKLFQQITDAIPASAMITRDRRPAARRLWWHSFEALQPSGMFRVPVGEYRMWIDTADPIISRCLAKHGYYEPAESKVMRALIKPGSTFVDCGANIGYYTLLAAESVGPRGKIYAFEPAPQNHRILRQNIEMNGLDDRAISYAVALGAAAGHVDIYLEKGNAGAHSILKQNVDDVRGVISVDVIPMDEILRGQHIDVIKIDTQGAEPGILRGATEILSRDRPLLMLEWWPWGLRDHGGSAGLAEVLSQFDYSAGVIQPNGTVQPLSWPVLLEAYSENDKDSGPMILCSSEKPLTAILPPDMIRL